MTDALTALRRDRGCSPSCSGALIDNIRDVNKEFGHDAGNTLSASVGEQLARGLAEAPIRRYDIGRVNRPQPDPENVGRLLRSLARNVATYAAATTLAADAGGADGALDSATVRGYLDALERLMIVESQPAWAPHLRSKSVLRRGSKRHFVDPALGQHSRSSSG